MRLHFIKLANGTSFLFRLVSSAFNSENERFSKVPDKEHQVQSNGAEWPMTCDIIWYFAVSIEWHLSKLRIQWNIRSDWRQYSKNIQRLNGKSISGQFSIRMHFNLNWIASILVQALKCNYSLLARTPNGFGRVNVQNYKSIWTHLSARKCAVFGL